MTSGRTVGLSCELSEDERMIYYLKTVYPLLINFTG